MNGTMNLKQLNAINGAIHEELSVTGNITSRGNIHTKNIKLNEDLSVAGEVNIDKDLNVSGATTIDGTLAVSDILNDVSIDGSLSVNDSINLNNKLSVGGDMSAKNVAIGGRLSVFGQATLNGQTTLNGKTTFRGDIIPAADEAYDIGSPQNKVRDLFVSDRSLWIGDQSRISYMNGRLQFMKRKVDSVPSSLLEVALDADNGYSDEEEVLEAALSHCDVEEIKFMKLYDWLSFMRTFNPKATINDVFNKKEDYCETSSSDIWKEDPETSSVYTDSHIGFGIKPQEQLHVGGKLKVEEGFMLKRKSKGSELFILDTENYGTENNIFDCSGMGATSLTRLYRVFGRNSKGSGRSWHWGFANDSVKNFSLSYKEPKKDPNVTFVFTDNSELYCSQVHANLKGNADTASISRKLATPRKINGVQFDGTADIQLPITYDVEADEPLTKQSTGSSDDTYNFILNGPVPGNTTGGAVHYINGAERFTDGGPNVYTIKNEDGDLRLGDLNRNITLEGTVKFSVPRKINGIVFDGTQDINLPSSSAATAAKLLNKRKINDTPFDGTTDIKVNGLTYNINEEWLCNTGDEVDSHFQMYGKKCSMVFRTDGTSAFGNNGRFPFVWLYGGVDSNEHRKMILNTDGNIWTESYGWLQDRFAPFNGSEYSDFQCSNLRLNSWIYFNEDCGYSWEGSNGTGWKIFPKDASYIVMQSGATATGGLCGTVQNNTPRGYVSWTSNNEIGFLNSDGNWSLKVLKNKTVKCFSDILISGKIKLGEKGSEFKLCDTNPYATFDTHFSENNEWGGYAINDKWVFTTNQNLGKSGVVDSEHNKWSIQFNENSYTSIFHDGVPKLMTDIYGIEVNGNINTEGVIQAANQILISGAAPSMVYFSKTYASALQHCEHDKLYFLRWHQKGFDKKNGKWPLVIDLNTNDCHVGGGLFANSLLIDSDVKLCANRGCVSIGGTRLGKFMQLNGDYWLHDQKNGAIELRNSAGNRWGKIRAHVESNCSLKLKHNINNLTSEQLDIMYKDAMSMDLVSYYRIEESPGYHCKRLGFILERSPSYLLTGTSKESYLESNWISMLHAATKVIDQKLSVVMDDVGKNLDFTGQHRTLIDDRKFSQYGHLEGLIVCADLNKYVDEVTIDKATPLVNLAAYPMDKSVYGVVSTRENVTDFKHDAYVKRECGDVRVKVNCSGEGGIWVCDINGEIESGDYITTSEVPGYGCKQDSVFLANYTVAKSTMDCDFERYRDLQKKIKTKTERIPYYYKDYESVADKDKYDAWDDKFKYEKELECYIRSEWCTTESPGDKTQSFYVLNKSRFTDNLGIAQTGASVNLSQVYDKVMAAAAAKEAASTSKMPSTKIATPQSLQDLPEKISATDWYNLPDFHQAAYSLVHGKVIDTIISTSEYEDGLKAGNKEWASSWKKSRKTFKIIVERFETKIPTKGYEVEYRNEEVNDLDDEGQLQWKDTTVIKERYPVRYLLPNGNQISQDEYQTRLTQKKTVYKAAFIGCTYHAG